MQKFMPELGDRERLQLMQDTAHKTEEGGKYYVPLSQEDLDAKREMLTENLIQLSHMEDELNVIKEEYKLKMKPLKTVNTQLLAEVKSKQELKEGNIYYMINEETEMMERYDHEGVLLDSRRLRPEERKGQSRLFVPSAMVKTGTDS